MANTRHLNSYLALALMLTLLTAAPSPTWASCKNNGGSQGDSKVGSEVTGSSVKICASATAVTPARTTVVVQPPVKQAQKIISKPVSKPAPKPSSKPLVKPNVQVAPKPVLRSVPRNVLPISKPTPKPVLAKAPIAKSPIKVVPKPVREGLPKANMQNVVSPGSLRESSDAGEFSPAQVAASVYPTNDLQVGQSANFVAPATVHYRTGVLLDMATEVRFTPTLINWTFADGEDGQGSLVTRDFDFVGSYSAMVQVTYAVAYRVRGGSTWILEPDAIVTYAEVLVIVSDGASGEVEPFQDPNPKKVRLVGSDCFERPKSFGCN